MDLEEGVEAVGLAREQRFELAPRDLGLEAAQHALGVGDHRGVVLGVAELDQGHLVIDLALDAADRREAVLERGALLHQAARLLRVVPEVGVLGDVVQLGEAGARLVEVKDASSAARPTA